MTVYLDGVFLLNGAVNFLLLYATARLAAAALRPGRLALGAALGAAYALGVYLPGLGFLTLWPFRILVAAGMLTVAFGLRRRLVSIAGVFGGLTLALCGAVYFGQLLRGQTPILEGRHLFFPVGWPTLVLTAGAVALACRLLLPRLTHSADSVVALTLELAGRRVFLSALRDTGNTLRDPATGQGVLVANWTVARELLGRRELRAEEFAAPAELMLRLRSLHPRLLPYRAVGVSSGLLLAIPCSIRQGKQVRHGLVAFCPTPVTAGGAYEALIGGESHV